MFYFVLFFVLLVFVANLSSLNVLTAKKSKKKQVCLVTPDAVKFPVRPVSMIYPLRDAVWEAYNLTLQIPFDSEAVSLGEFGRSWGQQLLLRHDCLHNAFKFY